MDTRSKKRVLDSDEEEEVQSGPDIEKLRNVVRKNVLRRHVKKRESVAQQAIDCGVGRSTLYRDIDDVAAGKKSLDSLGLEKPGPEKYFDPAEEEEIVRIIKNFDSTDNGLTMRELRALLATFAVLHVLPRRSIPNAWVFPGLTSEKFAREFRKRHQSVLAYKTAVPRSWHRHYCSTPVCK